MPSPTWLQMGLTAVKDLSNGDGCNCASLLRFEAQLSEGELSASNFLRTPLTACTSTCVKGKICLLTLQRELWLSYNILWLQFLSQMCVSPVRWQRYMFPHTCSFSHFQSHLWTGFGPSWPRILDRYITFVGTATIDFPSTSIGQLIRKLEFEKISTPHSPWPGCSADSTNKIRQDWWVDHGILLFVSKNYNHLKSFPMETENQYSGD